MTNRNYLIFSLFAALSIGLAPFTPEPHIVGKLRWLFGGGQGMQTMDYLDLLMHGLPWVMLVYFGYRFFFSKEEKEKTAAMKAAMSNPKVKIIDVREPNEYNAGHHPKALNFPLSKIGQEVEKLKAMEGPYVLYCRSGMRSGQAQKVLKQKGLQDVHNAGNLSTVKRLES